MRIKAKSDKVLLRCGRKNLYVTSDFRDVTESEMELLKDYYGDKLKNHIETKEDFTPEAETKSPDSPPEKNAVEGVSLLKLPELLKEVKSIDDLEALLEDEKNGANRKGAIKLIEERMKKL